MRFRHGEQPPLPSPGLEWKLANALVWIIHYTQFMYQTTPVCAVQTPHFAGSPFVIYHDV